MANRIPLALGIVVWAALSAAVQADPIGAPNQFNWVAYFAGLNGSAAAPVTATSSSSSTVANAPSMVVQPVPAAATTPPVTVVANAPVSQPQTVTSAAPVDAFINLGTGPYPLQSVITTGNAQAWFNSSQITEPVWRPADRAADSELRQRSPPASRTDFQPEWSARDVDRQPERPGLAHAQPGLEHLELPAWARPSA